MPGESEMAGRVALVTGASRGIGESIARRFAAAGAVVAVTARTVEDGDHPMPGSISATVRSILDDGGSAVGVPADLSRAEQRDELVDRVGREVGPIDILVNNAAITYFNPVASFQPRRFELMLEVQVGAPMHLAQLVIPGMRAAGRGWILNISSRAAIHPAGPPYAGGAGGTVYGMCKAALERFTTGLASELYSDGIAVNCLSPSGLVLTPGVKHHELDKRVPVDRHEPVEIMAKAAFALCSGSPSTLTGRLAYSQDLIAELGL